ncbi:hypothetical protein J18TS1_29000 [Oceanobacillus oncorhynchi subsp. incaldanensis]|nr:hypothetical protein J18TS1_29000 [Oceanobacillus oncorhynchi subsp. incaldanensis]
MTIKDVKEVVQKGYYLEGGQENDALYLCICDAAIHCIPFYEMEVPHFKQHVKLETGEKVPGTAAW